MNIDSEHTEPSGTAVMAFRELQQLARQFSISDVEWRAHPLLVVSSEVVHEVVINSAALEVAPGVFCAAPREVYIRFAFVDRVIAVAREAAIPPLGNACAARALSEHGMKIIRAEDQVCDDFVASFLDRYGAELARIKQTPATSGEDAEQKFGDGARRLVDGAVFQLVAERERRIAEVVNAPDELRRLRAACGSTVGKVEAAIGVAPR